MNDVLDPMVVAPVAAVVVILGGILFAVFQSQRSKGAAQRVERWAHGAYSLWTGGEDCATWPRDRAQNSLSNWYGANGAAAFDGVIAGLRSGQTGNEAWDKVRALDLLRIGLAAEYLDAEDCRKAMSAIGLELQQRYKSWQELATAFETGMNAWQSSRGVTDPQQLGRVRNNLPKLQKDVWPRIRYDAPLAVED